MQKADGDGAAAIRDQARPGGSHLIAIKWRNLYPVMRNAFSDFDTMPPRYDRVRKFQEKIVDIVALLDAEFQHVTKTTRSQKPSGSATPFDQRIGDECGAMENFAKI